MIKKLTSNIVIYGGTNALKSLVPFLMLPILTSYITPSQYGTLSLIETSILFLLPFIMLNINGAISVEYFKSSCQDNFKQYVNNAIFLSFISFIFFFCITFFFGKIIADLINLNIIWIELLSIFVFLRVLSTIILIIFQSSLKSKYYAIFSISQTLIDFSLSYYLVVINKLEILGRLSGIYITFFIFSIITIYFLYKMGYFKHKFTLKYTKEILAFGIPLIPHSIAGVILAMSDRYFISYYIGNSEVGLYTVSYQVSALMLLISMSVNQAWSPIFFKMLKNEDYSKIKLIITFLFVFFIIMSLFTYFISDFIYLYFIDEQFFDSKHYFLFLLIGFSFQSFYFLFTNYLFFYKRTFSLSIITAIGALINIILNYYLINSFGTIGVAYATAITWIIYFCIVFTYSLYLRKKYE
ncbi:MAG: oligosaccharide flippase family protein [Campylobacterales bacterium]|nr:oligosaccharide flippase family protein [Campylobacterales bacterium]